MVIHSVISVEMCLLHYLFVLTKAACQHSFHAWSVQRLMREIDSITL